MKGSRRIANPAQQYSEDFTELNKLAVVNKKILSLHPVYSVNRR